MITKKIIGKNLYILRKNLDLSREDVAKKVGISVDYVGKLETGIKKNISSPLLISLSAKLKTTDYWLCEGTGWSYVPESWLDAIRFTIKQIDLGVQKINVIKGGSESEHGLVFHQKDYTLSMSTSIKSEEAEAQKMYRIVLDIISHVKVKRGRY